MLPQNSIKNKAQTTLHLLMASQYLSKIMQFPMPPIRLPPGRWKYLLPIARRFFKMLHLWNRSVMVSIAASSLISLHFSNILLVRIRQWGGGIPPSAMNARKAVGLQHLTYRLLQLQDINHRWLKTIHHHHFINVKISTLVLA